jgi:hypothetical protein
VNVIKQFLIDKNMTQELHDTIKAELWRVKELGAKPRHTWQEAVLRWVNEQGHKSSIKTDIELLRWLDGHLRGKLVSDIDLATVQNIQQTKAGTGAKNATVNRVMALLRAILNKNVNGSG